jgi:benzodiazapine receptor
MAGEERKFMKNPITRQIINILAVIATIVVNGLANVLPLNGLNTGEISDRFQVYFVPAGYVFSIWGLIYIGLILFAIYQALPSQRDNPRLEKVGYLFAMSCLANIVWLFLWHYEYFVLTLVAMLSLLGLLIAIYLRLGIGRVNVSAGERWLVHVPFSVYLGWVSVATIANVTDVLDYLKWGGWGIPPQWWAVIMLIVGVGLAFAMGLTRGDAAYMLVVIWAFAGIAVKQSASPLVSTTAWIATGLTAVLIVVSLILYRRTRPLQNLAS